MERCACGIRHIILQPVKWETNSTPRRGRPPQAELNEQIAETSDIVIGVFGTKIGTPTERYVSGTVEEILNHLAAGGIAKVYFSDAPVQPSSIDHDQYAALQAFKRKCRCFRASVSSFVSAGGAGGMAGSGCSACGLRRVGRGRAGVVGAHGQRGADTLAVNDDGGLGCLARRYPLGLGVVVCSISRKCPRCTAPGRFSLWAAVAVLRSERARNGPQSRDRSRRLP